MANNRIKGITIEIGGDTTGLDKALKGTNAEIKNTQSQLADVERLLKLDPSNTELLKQKQQLLGESIKGTKEKLDALKEAEKQAQQQFEKGDISKQQYDGLKREIIDTEQQLKKLEETAGSASAKLKLISDKSGEFGEKATSAGKAMMPVTAGIVAIGAAGVSAAMELDDGYDTIITKTGATGKALEDMRQIADNVFTSLPTEMDDVGAAVGEINTRFGATGDKLEDLTEKFIKYAQINGTDVEQSIQLVSRAMGDAGIPMEQAGSILDKLTVAGQASGVSLDKLTENITKYGAPMRALGMTTDESIAIFAGWEKAGVNTEIAFSGMKKAIGTWGKEGKDSREEFQKTLEAIKNAPDIAEATAMAIETFGQKAGPDLADAIKGGRFEYKEFLDLVQGSAGIVSQTWEETQDPWDQAKVAANNLKLAASDLGSTLLETLQPILEQVVGKVKEFTQWFRGLSDEQKEMIVKIGAVVAAIAPLLLIIGKISGGVSALTGLFSSAGGLGSALSALASPIGIAIAAIVAIIAIIAILYNTNEDFREKMQEIWAGIQERISLAVEKIKDIISSFIELVTLIWQKWGDEITASIALTLDFIMTIIENALNIIEGIIKFFSAILKGDWEGAWEAVKQILESVAKIIIAVAKQMFDMAILGIKAVLKLLPETVQNGFAGAIDFLTSLPSKALQWGKDFIDGLVKGIKDKVSAVTDAVKGVADKITSYLHFSRPDVGPLREYETWMPDFMEGLAKGIKDNKWKVEKQVNVLASDMSSSAGNTDLSGLISAIGKQTQSLSGMQVVLNDGTLVGKLMPQIERGLNANYQQRERG